MYLIVGLGNPEEKYSKTRHNMGFNVINKLSSKYEIKVNKRKFEALYGEGVIEEEKVILLKPQTYMNLSGKSIIKVINFYKIPLENIIVVYDDMDIAQGLIRIRKKGSSGSHNGMKSVISELNSEEFARVRVGIGKPKQKYEMIDYVIGEISKKEEKELDKGVERAKEAIIEILKSGIDRTMNKFN